MSTKTSFIAVRKSERSTCLTRRKTLRSLVGGSMLLPGIVSQLMAETGGELDPGNPLAPKTPPLVPRAKQVIFLFMTGGMSHIDTFDPKPDMPNLGSRFMPSPWAATPHGESGIWVSSLFPNIANIVDKLCLIRSMENEHSDHVQATLGIHTGSVTVPRPSMGSWLSYGLGTFNQNLPSYMVIAPRLPYGGARVFGNDFLPPIHQGTRIVPGPEPIVDLHPRTENELARTELNLLQMLNRNHLKLRPSDAELSGRIRTFETAFRMQSEAPDAFDLSQESESTLRLYGLKPGQVSGHAWQCLVARRLVERGVRCIEVIDTGTNKNWDSHQEILEHKPLAGNIDQSTAALVLDLESRGLLDETLVVFATEFGRTPGNDLRFGHGRNHYPNAFTCWLAGGGVKQGHVHGETDETGSHSITAPVTMNDFHATILYLMGIDHERLTYRHAGRNFRLTDVAGRVVDDVVA